MRSKTAVVLRLFCAPLLVSLIGGPAQATILWHAEFDSGDGLKAEATWQLSADPSPTLTVTLRNTSDAIPAGFGAADQILTGLSWDFGDPGINAGDTQIIDDILIGGDVLTGPSSSTNGTFDLVNVGPNGDVSPEYGFSNTNGSGALPNFVSANSAGATKFIDIPPGSNMDGPGSIDGPQGGLISAIASIPLGGQGAITDQWVATLSLNESITDQQLGDWLKGNGSQVEFGSDKLFLFVTPTPEPSSLVLALLAAAGGGLMVARRYLARHR